ncbi:MAG: GNAT family N-acetyltransferase [Thermomicrobiales bacterium]
MYAAAFGIGEDGAMRYAATSVPEMAALSGFMAAIASTMKGELIGFACGHDAASHRPWFDRVGTALERAGHHAWLDDPFELAEVAVHPSIQGRGVGTLLSASIQERLGGRRAILVTYHDDHPAKRFYRRLGWQVLVEDFEYAPGRPYTSILGFRRADATHA